MMRVAVFPILSHLYTTTMRSFPTVPNRHHIVAERLFGTVYSILPPSFLCMLVYVCAVPILS